ncbi:MAG TPA: S26 family signal peptidase [Planctomycetota bacterium]|nr:S26 family signal peptidase [Planctomycetota bacterium]
MAWHREFRTLARDAVAVAAIAVLTVQALRRWCGDRYLVDSGSMQPVLYGDPNAGDVVFVDKLASAEARRRHDLVVVEHPDKPGQQLVKRIAARGDDADARCIDIKRGDIWLGPDRQRLQRETKDPLLARSMRVRWASFRPGMDSKLLDLRAAVVEDSMLRLPAVSSSAVDTRVIFGEKARSQRRLGPSRVVPTGFVGNDKPVDATYIDALGVRGAVGEDVGVTDCGMELEVLDPTELLCSIDVNDEVLTFHWQPGGCLELWRNGETVEGTRLPPTPKGAHRIEYGLLDDRAFFVVDGRADAMLVFARRSDWLPVVDPGSGWAPRCFVHIGVVGDRPLCITSLHVFRDTFAVREPLAVLPCTLEPGQWFLLGDSPFDSRDSRHFGPVSASKFLGLPRVVLGPWPRCRWLCP